MKISVRNCQKDLPISIGSVRLAARAALQYHSIPCDGLALHFVDEKKICSLHDKFFNDPSFTDCITFPCDQEESFGSFFLGDLFVCPKAAILFVKESGGDVYEEVTLYVIHGILHLLGYDDIETSDRKKMRLEEKKLLHHLRAQKAMITK